MMALRDLVVATARVRMNMQNGRQGCGALRLCLRETATVNPFFFVLPLMPFALCSKRIPRGLHPVHDAWSVSREIWVRLMNDKNLCSAAPASNALAA